MKSLPILLSSVLLLSACSKTVREIHQNSSETKDPISSDESKQKNNQIESLNKLLNSKAPNLALAELVAKTISNEKSAILKKAISELSAQDVQEIINNLQLQNEKIRDAYLFNGQRYQHNLALIQQSAYSREISIDQSLVDKLRVATLTKIKNKALEDIILSYEKRANEINEVISAQLAYQIGINDKKVAGLVEEAIRDQEPKEKIIEMIQKSQPVIDHLKMVDKTFKRSDLNEDEQYTVLMGALIAGGIYLHVKDNEGFKKIVEQGKRIIHDIKDIQSKVNEFGVLVSTMKKHFTDAEVNVRNLGEGLNGAGKDIETMYRNAQANINNANSSSASKVESKKILDFLYNKVVKGKDAKKDETNPSVLSKQRQINANLEKTINAVEGMTNNLSAILDTTQKFAAIFKIKPPKDLLKVMHKAQQVAQVVGAAKDIMAGWATGGPLGAVTALSSGSLSKMLGGGQDDNSAQFEMINRKLDVIIQNQQKMMEMQVETMNMIKNLALLLDQYHQKEMMELSELRDYILVGLELGKAQQNENLRYCERMINFQLRSVWSRYDFNEESTKTMSQIRLIGNKFNSNISSLDDIRRVITSVEENGFNRCQSGLGDAFGGSSNIENPLRAIFESSDDEDLLSFQREKYLPLLESLRYFAGTENLDSVPLHFPLTTYESLKIKTPYIASARGEVSANAEIYDLDNLVSVKNLERYLSNLILLHPFIEIDKPVWMKTFSEIIETYLQNSNFNSNQNSRSHFFLNNALKLIQSAIAQEAILAGEPIIVDLYNNYLQEIFSSKKCEELTSVGPGLSKYPLACSVRSNKLLMKNLIGYTLSMQNDSHGVFLPKYESAFSNKDLKTLSLMLGRSVSEQQLKVIDDSIYLNLQILDSKKMGTTVSLKLPTLEELKAGNLFFSENMSRLMLMQKIVIEELEKVTPIDRSFESEHLLELMMASN
jgi:hypothetical protein